MGDRVIGGLQRLDRGQCAEAFEESLRFGKARGLLREGQGQFIAQHQLLQLRHIHQTRRVDLVKAGRVGIFGQRVDLGNGKSVERGVDVERGFQPCR